MAKQKNPFDQKYQMYGLIWPASTHPANRELQMIAHGGQWQKKNKSGMAGNGLKFHFKEFIKTVWPEVDQHRWFDFFLENWLTHKYVGVMGPRNSGKTCGAALFHLTDWYAFPHCTTVLLCSTTAERLQDRIFGEIKKFHRLARQRIDWLPGSLIEGRLRIVYDDADEISEGRDFRNGIAGVPIKKGSNKGMEDFIGIKNKRMRLCGDEVQLLPNAFIDVTANLSGNHDFKATGMGNPSQTTDSLGLLCEPAAHLGGWDSGVDQTPLTKVWETRFPNGCCVQLPGSDTPNKDAPGPPRYPYLMSTQQMDEEAKHWGRDDWRFNMFFEGRMPRGQGSRRVLTRNMCERGNAMDDPVWRDNNRTQIASLDAAFRAVGGDRCVFTRCQFGLEASAPLVGPDGVTNLISQSTDSPKGRVLFALIEQKIIPISAEATKGAALTIEDAEDQICKFVMSECQTYGIPPENFFFDCGMKASLASAFARLWSKHVVPIDFGDKPTERKLREGMDVTCRQQYFNFVTEMWYSARLVVDAGQFRGLTESVMLEGCKREFRHHTGSNKIQVETKEEMKEKCGESPDRFDSLVIALEGARRRGFQIGKFDNKEADAKDSKWKSEAREKAKRLWKSGQLTYS